MARNVDDVGLLTAAMARDHSIGPMSFPRDRGAFVNVRPAELKQLRVAVRPDLGFAPTSKMIRRVFEARTKRFADAFGMAEEASPDLSQAARVNRVLRGLQ
jgi:Asp-tRNA(Asn)/Glu-tRNA(Gln) amidotransferase A subunit family amidase